MAFLCPLPAFVQCEVKDQAGLLELRSLGVLKGSPRRREGSSCWEATRPEVEGHCGAGISVEQGHSSFEKEQISTLAVKCHPPESFKIRIRYTQSS